MKKILKKTIAVLVFVAVTAAVAACNDKRNEIESETEREDLPVGGAGLANPWKDTDPEEIKEKLGWCFSVPEGAEDVVYRWAESLGIAEMDFILDGNEWTARAKVTDEKGEDISGYYYPWEEGDVIKVDGVDGEYRILETSEGTVNLAVLDFNGYTLSLGTVSKDGTALLPIDEVFVF